MKKLRTGDEVIVISGKDTGKTGTLSKFISKQNVLFLELKSLKNIRSLTLNSIYKEILEKESPIDVSNSYLQQEIKKSRQN